MDDWEQELWRAPGFLAVQVDGKLDGALHFWSMGLRDMQSVWDMLCVSCVIHLRSRLEFRREDCSRHRSGLFHWRGKDNVASS